MSYKQDRLNEFKRYYELNTRYLSAYRRNRSQKSRKRSK